MKSPEELAEQRAYIASLTAEQRSELEEYVIAEEQKLYADAAADWEMQKQYAAKRLLLLTGAEKHQVYVRHHEEIYRIYEKKHDEACIRVASALARLNELAPEGHYFDEATGRYQFSRDQYVCPVMLPKTGTELTWRTIINDSVYDFWRSSTVSVAPPLTATQIQDAMNRLLYGSGEVNVSFEGFYRGLAEQEKLDALSCECGAHKASGAPRGAMHSSWCSWRAA